MYNLFQQHNLILKEKVQSNPYFDIFLNQEKNIKVKIKV